MSGPRVDVLVAGGGPVGLATAIGCKLAGLSVLVAEPRPGPVDKACGEGVMPAAVRRLAALGVTPDGYPLRGIRYREAHRAGGDGGRPEAGDPGASGAEALFRHGHGLGVRRTVLHAALAERAAELAIPVLPVRVTALEQHPGHVRAAGVEARFLVAADGLHSAVRRLLEPAEAAAGARPARYGLRRHYHAAPWTDMVEVHWAGRSEAYVTPVAAGVVGVALLFAGPARDGRDGDERRGGGFDGRLAADFPELRARLRDATPASTVRGAGPLRHDVRRRVHGRVLLVGDASGYLDALTGEGIGVGVAQAEALARCLAAGRPGDYERAWRQVSGPAWRLTAGLLWSRGQPLLAARIVPAARRLPWIFSALVNHAAQALARQ